MPKNTTRIPKEKETTRGLAAAGPYARPAPRRPAPSPGPTLGLHTTLYCGVNARRYVASRAPGRAEAVPGAEAVISRRGAWIAGVLTVARRDVVWTSRPAGSRACDGCNRPAYTVDADGTPASAYGRAGAAFCRDCYASAYDAAAAAIDARRRAGDPRAAMGHDDLGRERVELARWFLAAAADSLGFADALALERIAAWADPEAAGRAADPAARIAAASGVDLAAELARR